MELDELQKHWQKFGEEDPLWAILTIPEMKNNKWDPEEFFRRGVDEVERVLKKIEAIGANVQFGRALDFGCGVGRLTQAMAAHFDEAYGVDIAPAMIEAANKFNKFDNKCRYYLNTKDDLSLFPDNHFDFIYSVIVLQHIHPKYSLNYMQEFLRVLRPGGLLVFQLPSGVKAEQTARKQSNLSKLYSWSKGQLHAIYQRIRQGLTNTPPPTFQPRMEMHGIPKERVLAFLEQNKAVVLYIQEDGWAGSRWESYIYFVTS